MSIIAAAADPGSSALALVVAGAAGLVSVTAAVMTGVLSPPELGRGHRIPPDRPMAPLVGVLLAGIIVWMIAPSLVLELLPGGPDPAPPIPPRSPRLSTAQLVTVGAVFPMLALGVMALGDAWVRPRVAQRLGLDRARLPGGALWGAVGILMALPLVYCVMVYTEWFYRVVGYEHPKAHDLLKAMDETPEAWVKYLAIVVAVVIAPLWEEFLFRGHIQTLIREGLIRLRQGGGGGGAGVPVLMTPGAAERAAAPPPPSGTPAEETRTYPLETCLAILLASLVFAGVHQPWQFPPIFCLSVCLGVAYERTGNLWVPVVMHASFNGLMTAYYLLHGPPN